MGLNWDSLTLENRSFSMTPWRLLVLSLTAALFTTPLLASAQSSASAGSGAAAGEQDCGALSAGECRVLGLRTQFGLGAPLDLVRALALFEDACSRGDPLACSEAGVAYATGYGTKINPETARHYFSQGCTPNLQTLCRDHGLSYLDANSPVRNLPKGVSILGRACWVGSAEACNTVAQINARAENGKGPLIGQIDSIRFFREACILGSVPACLDGAGMIAQNPALDLFEHSRNFMLTFACSSAQSQPACAQLPAAER